MHWLFIAAAVSLFLWLWAACHVSGEAEQAAQVVTPRPMTQQERHQLHDDLIEHDSNGLA